MDLAAILTPLPEPAALQRMRGLVGEALATMAQAEGALSALRLKAMLSPNQPVSPADVMSLKRAEKVREEARRVAYSAACEEFGDLSAEVVLAWEREVSRAESAFTHAVARMEAEALEGRRPGEDIAAAIAKAILALGWALCDLPIALRIKRTGENLQEVASG